MSRFRPFSARSSTCTRKLTMPGDLQPPPNSWPQQHQPLDFSTKNKPRFYVYPPSPPKFHHSSQPTPMSFFRPAQHSPAPAQHSPLNVQHFGFLDAMNGSYRSVGVVGGISQQPYSFLDTRRSQSKNIRPFKAYPRDPLALPLGYCGLAAPVVPIDIQQTLMMQNDAYEDFRKNMMMKSAGRHAEREKGPSMQFDEEEERRKDEDSTVDVMSSPESSPRSPRSLCGVSEGVANLAILAKKKPRNLPDEFKDGAYWERRRKNNEAAKRSRDARRAKEDEIAIRAAYLEQENMQLKVELNTMKNETNRLRCMLFNAS